MVVQTHKQYHADRVREVASEYELPMSEVERLYPLGAYWSDYVSMLLASISAGVWPSYRVWATLPESLRADIAREHIVRTNDEAAQQYAAYRVRDRAAA